ncbi:MAG: prolipoprotein diacylglyceryl transferase [Ferrovum sp. 37-45-19]|uniref:prolipoprotein diacylglyceryl transferase n=1 Tax=Ferrovum sp. JA12 TaxID=1356299 RepID=UPI00070245C4|nr:prolipoprotein diacylglyceryl transferase [Ferrovum sp. JA12]OYV80449.1 MAG: prolipoprotein diacylglyceryl transferase [Ferrovum sp. 21-44-67]OYV94764.1 MAG: prolipoprotein diacylglyceryl transferase [Ferrovum sp. 37-45-19]OZB31904.1 MAG: prolipoprotein diacylglyceryl transferase [Ferrovum sp. 34-44-207]HQT81116.1 prolipoprotein diacylglyceryl transferase [Ferrovaceae bacterium]KRH79158.1 prolipoprotein diacylglyceryl transferase [Ferrovum sp. JA12]
MLVHPNFDPVAIHLGPLTVRWYGLMYLFGFLAGSYAGRWRINTQPWLKWSVEEVDQLLTYVVFGVIVGGRLGYVLFYKPEYYFSHPLEIVALWKGGMSFHGGFLGVTVASSLFARRSQRRWLDITDFVAPLVTFGLGFGRLGNFINGELPGRPTSLPWGMIFPNTDLIARHPSQLYEALLEGLVLGTFLFLASRKQRPTGVLSAYFLMGYGSFRFLVEFTREPDNFLGLLDLGLSMGQWLSLPMIIAGLILWRSSLKSAMIIK